MAVPLVPPLQLGLVPVTESVNTGGLVNVVDPEIVQLLESVTVTVYVAADKPDMVDEVAVVDHKYVYPGVPPPAVAVAVPFVPPLQLGSVSVTDRVRAAGAVKTTLSVAVQLLPSVTVTVYVLAAKLDIVEDVEAFDQR